MTHTRYLFAIAISMVFSAGCDLKKSADEMKDTSNEIKTHSEHLAKRTDDLEAELVKKEASVTMDQYLDIVFFEGPYSTMDRAQSEPDQTTAAGKAVQSMLFQYWKGDYNEDLQFLDARVSLTAKAFFPRLIKHIPRDFKVDVFKPDYSWTGVAALGAFMDEMDPRYEKVLRDKGMPHLSFYEIVMEALRGRMTLERKELLPAATARILQYAQEAEYMVQLRHNYLPMLVVCRMTDFQEREILWNQDLGRLWVRLMGIEGKIEDKAPESILEWKLYLELALKTRNDLRAMGITPKINGTLAGIVQGLNFNQAKWINMDPAALSREDLLRREFAKVYNDVVFDALTLQHEAQK